MIFISINCVVLDRGSIFIKHLDNRIRTDQAQEPTFSWWRFACLSSEIHCGSPLWTGAKELHHRNGVDCLWLRSVLLWWLFLHQSHQTSLFSLHHADLCQSHLDSIDAVMTHGLHWVGLVPVAEWCILMWLCLLQGLVVWLIHIIIHSCDMLCSECAWVLLLAIAKSCTELLTLDGSKPLDAWAVTLLLPSAEDP